MIKALPALVATAAAACVLAVHLPPTGAVAGEAGDPGREDAPGRDDPGRGDPGHDDDRPGQGDDWRSILGRAVDGSHGASYHGRMVVVTLGEHGPQLAEVEVRRAADGELRVGRAERWLVGRSGAGAFLWREDAGRLLTLGPVQPVGLSLERLEQKYDVTHSGEQDLLSGPAAVLTLSEHGAAAPRERLYVDADSGLVVRRETFGADGRPRRLVAFTELEITDVAMSMPDGEVEELGPRRTLSQDGLRGLDDAGWVVPRELPGAFRRVRGYADRRAEAALHLVYSDGLYTLSLYEQAGRVDSSSLVGAVGEERDGMHLWRWPGAEPERLVWSGDGRTFTVVSDAPLDELVHAVSTLPNDRPTTGLGRIRRGLARAASWLWPFG